MEQDSGERIRAGLFARAGLPARMGRMGLWTSHTASERQRLTLEGTRQANSMLIIRLLIRISITGGITKEMI